MALLDNIVNAIRKRTLDKTNLDEKLGDAFRGVVNSPTGRAARGLVKSTYENIKPYGQNLLTAGKQGLGVGLTALGGYDPTPDFIQRPAARAGVDLAEQALKERQQQKILTPRQVLTRVPLNTARAAATVYGAAKAPINAVGLGAAGLIGAGVAKLKKEDPYEGFGKGVGQGFETIGFTSKVTDPLITSVAGKAAGQVARRLITGAGNVAEDELLAKLDDIQPGMADRLMSFGLGAVISPQANQDVATSVKTFLKKLGNQFNPQQQKKIASTIVKHAEQATSDKVRNITRRIKVTENGQPIEDILVPETRATRRGTNGYQPKYKDFKGVSEVSAAAPAKAMVQDPNNPRRFIPQEMNAMGAVGGIETYQDENGKTKVRYNPTKGAIGLVGATVGKKALDSLKPNQLSNELDAILGTTADVAKTADLPSTKPTESLDAILGDSTPKLPAGNVPLPLPEGTYTAKTGDEARSLIRKLTASGRLGAADVQIEPNILKPGTKAIAQGAPEMVAKNSAEARQFAKQFPQSKVSLKPNEDVIKGFQPDTGERTKLSEIEQILYGSATPEKTDLGGSKEGVGKLSNMLRKGQEKVSTVVGDLSASENPVVRNTARLLQGFSGGLGKSADYMGKSAGYKGAVDYGNKIANDTQKFVADMVQNSPESLKKMHAVLDPDLADTKVKFEDLNPAEQEATKVLQKISDYINDTNYQNGFITKEKWNEGRGGKYIARAYEEYDFPPEIADFQKQKDLKFDLNPFKKREGVTDWKMENAVRDPSYLVAKRLQQTVFNDEVKKMSQFLTGQPNLVSGTARPGFEQLSEHPAWGDLSGKFVRKDIVDDIKGFHFSNDGVQKVYDLLNWWDKNPIRRTRKQILTVFNPAVRLGNKTGNYVFAWMSGINPKTFGENRKWASTAINSNDELYRRMIKDGMIGGDASRADIQRFALELKNEVDTNPELMVNGADTFLKRQIENIQKSYGETDDASKLAAMKTFLDRGYSYEEAGKRVLNSFQNYNTTGFLFDIGAKLPVFGNPFVRFQGDLMRILKNAAIDHPIRAASTMLGWQAFTKAMSIVSGESEEDKQTRESRVGSARIPFTNISLAVQTPWGELNASRLIGIMAMTPVGGASAVNDLSRILPIQNPLDARNLGSDPVIGPVVSTLIDKDFRGKSIADPDQNKYTGSLLTEGEKMGNRAKYLLRQYMPPTGNDIQDVLAASKGEENFYGQKRTLPQALLRLGGLKVEQFGAPEAQAARDKENEYSQSAIESKQKQISTIKNQLQSGKIDEATANKRIEAIQGQISKETQTLQGVNTSKGTVSAAGGTLPSTRVQSLNKLFGMPATASSNASALQKATYKTQVFKKLNDVYDAEWLPENEKASYVAQVAGISEDQAKYYGVARLTDDERLGYITDEIGSMDSKKLLPYLATLREQVNEKQILTNSVIDDLEDEGTLTDAQAKYLKKVKYNKSTGKIQYTGTEGTKALKDALKLMEQDNADRKKLIDNLWSTQSKIRISGDINTMLSAGKRKTGGSEINAILKKSNPYKTTIGRQPK